MIIAGFLKKTAAIETTSIRLHDADLENSLMKEKCSYVLLPVFMFWYSRFNFRNLKNANPCVFVIYYNQQSINLFLA